ncbi:MAG: HAD family phosphatase [Caldilineaceae bacterium]
MTKHDDLPPLTAVVFDMDGLMVDTEIIYHIAWRNAANALGYVTSDATLMATTGRRMEDCYALLQQAQPATFPMAEFKTIWPRYWHDYVLEHGIAQKAGLAELLDLLDDLQIPKAVATSSAWDEAIFTLQQAEIAHRFAIVVSGDQVTNGKPAPEIFLTAAQRLGVAPSHCMALEDSEAGVLAASAAGMVTVMVPDLIQPTPAVAQRAYRVASSLHEVSRLVRSFWSATQGANP